MVLNDGQNVDHHGEQQNPVEQLFVKEYPDTHERAIPRLLSGVDRDDLGQLDDTEQPALARPAVCEMRRPLRGTRTRSRYNALCATQDADRAGIHRTYVSDIERGKRNPTVTVVEKLAGPLGVASGRLLD